MLVRSEWVTTPWRSVVNEFALSGATMVNEQKLPPDEVSTQPDSNSPAHPGSALNDERGIVELSRELRAELLDPVAWNSVLETYARTIKVAVALTDCEGVALGRCHNPQPVWQFVRREAKTWKGNCFFCLSSVSSCAAVPDALRTGGVVMTHGLGGFVHLAVPLILGGQPLGAIIAGQVFDRYPEALPLERVASESHVSAQQLWHLAIKQRPVSRTTLQVYGELLFTLGQAFIRQLYGATLQRKLAESNHRFRLLVDTLEHQAAILTEQAALLDLAQDAIVVLDLRSRILFWNHGAEAMYGWLSEEVLGRNINELLKIEYAEPTENIEIKFLHRDFWEGEAMHHKRDGRRLIVASHWALQHNEKGAPTRILTISNDITDRQKAETALRDSEAQMTYSAQHDFLTGLPNRRLLEDRIDQAIALASRNRNKVAVLFMDLDGFKRINDSLGHPVGDQLLRSIAKRLTDCVRGSDTVSRQGGDEFVVLLAHVEKWGDAANKAKQMLHAVSESHLMGQHDLRVTTSIGVSLYPDDGLDAETLIKNADTAMYKAKEGGHRNILFFTPALNAQAAERQFIEAGLRRAIERQELVLHYQPKINLRTGTITGAEALIRWMHPVRGIVPPAQFISIAEECGLIQPIGNWVLREAFQQTRAWKDAGLPLTTVAVNVSAKEFRDKSYSDGVFKMLEDTGLDPGSLELELTESVLMDRSGSMESILNTFRAKGVKLAVDDFGTGYSSLNYLSRFPIDALKIDQSFVHEITTRPADTTIVTAVIGLGRSLKLRVIAEGVETQEELAFLQAHLCEEAQGYYFSPPVPSEQFARLLETGISTSVLT
jgi:diguanylate cyclase (GGDEF)-like protein/PAS domain S-box-containing protein